MKIKIIILLLILIIGITAIGCDTETTENSQLEDFKNVFSESGEKTSEIKEENVSNDKTNSLDTIKDNIEEGIKDTSDSLKDGIKEGISETSDKVKDGIEEGINSLSEETKEKLVDNSKNITNEIKKITVSNNYETVKVIRVIDGDTLIVDKNGTEERVRMVGMNTPESVGANINDPEPYGIESSNFTKELLPAGKTIYMTKDIENRDKYDRLLRYIWLDKPNNLNMKETMVNAILVKEGFANVMTIQPNSKYSLVFKGLETQARTLNKGLWGLE
ncbi:thermonuclease family protein [Senegalia massiliensis]|uniref:TNase-like domain-containing protein n=1 Tax=Senegalia massiliensis TaxID=1720316 RepID=A0A845QZ28_9CLOT|nr:thermonuclease family protein [Senegalia massiliensis]NBI07561.1 hypothetical protein [Senegalia massiliensis]